MSSRKECDEAYQFLGFDKYRTDITESDFNMKLKAARRKVKTSQQNLLIINAQRAHGIYKKATSKREKDHLAQCYFDKVEAVEICFGKNSITYPYQDSVLEIYVANEKERIYTFLPIMKYSYIYRYLRSDKINLKHIPLDIDTEKYSDIELLTTQYHIRYDITSEQREKINHRNKEFYTIDGEICTTTPEWGYWSWAPWKVYAAYTNTDRTLWNYCHPHDNYSLNDEWEFMQ